MWGRPVVDPTENVQKLVEASIRRLDDVQCLHIKRIDAIIIAHELYTAKLADVEKGRIDAIRAMDSKAVVIASEQAHNQALLLAEQLKLAESGLRRFIENVQETARLQLEAQMSHASVRITELERNQYKNLGREQISKSVFAVMGAIVGALITYITQRMMMP